MNIDNRHSMINFKMRLSPRLASKIKTDIFKNNNADFDKFNKLFEKVHANTEPSTLLDIYSPDGNSFRLIYSSELFPGTKFADMEKTLTKKDVSNLHIYLLNLCTKCTADNELKLFFKGAKELLEQYIPVNNIKSTAQKFKVNAQEKKNKFESYIEEITRTSKSNNPNQIFF